MEFRMKKSAKWFSAIALAAVMPLTHAAAVISNGGFENGDSPWTFDPAANVKIVNGGHASAHSLNFNSAKSDGGVEENAAATQMFSSDPASPGSYLFQFWAKGLSLTSSEFTTSYLDPALGPVAVALQAGTTNDLWTNYFGVIDYLDVSNAILSFMVDISGLNGTSSSYNFFIDDVSLTACDQDVAGSCDVPRDPGQPSNGVPEPGSLFLVGAALAAVAFIRRKAKA